VGTGVDVACGRGAQAAANRIGERIRKRRMS
jgi:hypothetical protein